MLANAPTASATHQNARTRRSSASNRCTSRGLGRREHAWPRVRRHLAATSRASASPRKFDVILELPQTLAARARPLVTVRTRHVRQVGRNLHRPMTFGPYDARTQPLRDSAVCDPHPNGDGGPKEVSTHPTEALQRGSVTGSARSFRPLCDSRNSTRPLSRDILEDVSRAVARAFMSAQSRTSSTTLSGPSVVVTTIPGCLTPGSGVTCAWTLTDHPAAKGPFSTNYHLPTGIPGLACWRRKPRRGIFSEIDRPGPALSR